MVVGHTELCRTLLQSEALAAFLCDFCFFKFQNFNNPVFSKTNTRLACLGRPTERDLTSSCAVLLPRLPLC
jgi:hypothetical protein